MKYERIIKITEEIQLEHIWESDVQRIIALGLMHGKEDLCAAITFISTIKPNGNYEIAVLNEALDRLLVKGVQEKKLKESK